MRHYARLRGSVKRLPHDCEHRASTNAGPHAWDFDWWDVDGLSLKRASSAFATATTVGAAARAGAHGARSLLLPFLERRRPLARPLLRFGNLFGGHGHGKGVQSLAMWSAIRNAPAIPDNVDMAIPNPLYCPDTVTAKMLDSPAPRNTPPAMPRCL